MSDYNKIKIGIINLKINNIYSIYQACKNIGYNTRIVSPRENFPIIFFKYNSITFTVEIFFNANSVMNPLAPDVCPTTSFAKKS